MTGKTWFGIVACIVVAGLAGLLISIKNSSSPIPAPASPPPGPASSSGAPTKPENRGRQVRIDHHEPGAPGSVPTIPVPITSPKTGTEKPPLKLVISAKAITSLRIAMRSPIRRCQEQFKTTLGDSAEIIPVTDLHVAAGQLSISSLTLSSENITGTELADCVQKALLGLSISVNDHPDVDRHTMRLPFRLPI